ncbi:Crp/Fnr family transcriptional regulator [Caballeronia mineralivorans]|uniref:Crp/Fnr family transcriptional regulator n=1 Tax=Caballeronia mineralivorans TaxID=2010198 RepID=UPI002AFEE45C|nr:helix-turn-helix domain-containing protein [Caballeronia mineralivorans]MEA3099788.1 family transcriptional regulator, cyclic receptor protein [Caballeronia mineralivorans]
MLARDPHVRTRHSQQQLDNPWKLSKGSPRGSLYFHFPKGKEKIGEAALTLAGEAVRQAIAHVAGIAEDAGVFLTRIARGMASDLEKSDYKEGCRSRPHARNVRAIQSPGYRDPQRVSEMGTTMAIEDSVITSITKDAMLTALRDQPTFSEMFMAYLLTRNSRIEEDLIDHLFNSSERRLARLLLLLANFGKEGSPQPISPNISQETLAEMIGTTRSRVSYFMNKFRKLGLIDYNGHIEVHNSLLSAVLHEKPYLHGEQRKVLKRFIDAPKKRGRDLG